MQWRYIEMSDWGRAVKLGFLVVGIFSQLCFAEGNQVKGFVRWDDASLDIQDSVAVWDATENELKIALFPFKLTAQDVEAIQKTPSQLGFSLIKKNDFKKLEFREGRLDMAFVGSLVQDYPSKTEYSWSVELQSEVLTPAAEPQ